MILLRLDREWRKELIGRRKFRFSIGWDVRGFGCREYIEIRYYSYGVVYIGDIFIKNRILR